MDDAQKRRIEAECWKAGNAALGKQNWDYAIDMFGRCAKLSPEKLLYRQALRGTEQKKYGDNKTGSKMAFFSLTGIRSKVRGHKGKKEWDLLDIAAEEGLALNPWDHGLNFELGEAAYERGYDDVAKFAIGEAIKMQPDNKPYLRRMAEVLERKGEYEQSIAVWERIQKLDPNDPEPRSRLNRVAANSTIDKGRYDTAKTTQETKLGYEERVSAGNTGGALAPGESQEKDLQMAIRKAPEDRNNYLKLGDYYRRNQKLEQAAEQFRKALEISGGDPAIREQVEDIEIELMNRAIDFAKEAAARNPQDDQARKNLAELTQERLRRQIEVKTTRVDRYPADTKLKYELGELLMIAGKFNLAIPLMQQSVRDQRYEQTALLNLGKCFLRENKYDLATRMLTKAAEKIDYMSHEKLFKECHYYLGWLYERAGDIENAEKHYNEVLGVDYEYKDTQKRLEELSKKDDDEGSTKKSPD